jgi:site-specific recombinase XerD
MLAVKSHSTNDLRDRVILKMLFGTGLRRAELVGLNVDDLDLDEGRLKTKRKGNKTVWLPLHPEIIKLLKEYTDSCSKQKDVPLFTSRLGNRLSGAQLWRIIKSSASKAGLSDKLTVHSFRHGHATTLLAQDVPIAYISRLLGHSSLNVTQRYTHIQDNGIRHALDAVNF